MAPIGTLRVAVHRCTRTDARVELGCDLVPWRDRHREAEALIVPPVAVVRIQASKLT
jgi:hypothetical protein